MIRDLLEQGVAAGEFAVADVDLTSRFIQAIGMEAVRQIHDDPVCLRGGHRPGDPAVDHRRRRRRRAGQEKADDGVDGSRAQLIEALARLPVPTPAATAVFVGAYDPARLGFKDKMIAALPASPLHGEPAHDERDWDAIGAGRGSSGSCWPGQ